MFNLVLIEALYSSREENGTLIHLFYDNGIRVTLFWVQMSEIEGGEVEHLSQVYCNISVFLST